MSLSKAYPIFRSLCHLFLLLRQFSVNKGYPFEDLRDQFIAFDLFPGLSRFENEFEHHGEGNKPGAAVLGLLRSEPYRRKG